ncbi:hypothetical protein [Palleronia caenipelagi]|uniref:Uncharacterized protein n=1 Tax=Palleronia caenipelagi TaxID=2489174 RepID=A0A547Q5P5_9RHOB|nr:hypothetical protein [Palleronia caenipelagi]TRD21693.1 hypothetical protein FEV53_08100 [Palleronia caenipelagi]
MPLMLALLQIPLSRDYGIVFAAIILAIGLMYLIGGLAAVRLSAFGLIMTVLGIALGYWTLMSYPANYTMDDLVYAFVVVFADIIK